MTARVVRIGVAPRGGVPKPEVPSAEVTAAGIAGNAVAHPKIHGGPDRAVCLWSEERILALQAEGHPVRPGSAGENLTLAGLDWAAVGPGLVLAVGDALRLEVTTPAAPCRQIAGSFAGGDSSRIDQRRHPGWSRWYARVLAPGTVRTGDAVRVERGAR